MLTDADFKGPSNSFKGDFQVKASTFLVASPDEILRALIDPQMRTQWDHNLKSARFDDAKKQMILNY